MRPLLATVLLLLCLSAQGQGWSIVGEPLTKQLGGGASNGVVCGQAPNIGSGWLEDMSVYTNCLNSDLIGLPLNGVRVTWSQVTNCPTLEHFNRNLVYSMSWSPDGTNWTLISSQTNNTRASDWMTNDVPAPYRSNGYYTVMVRESDWTGGGSPAIADWYYATNTITPPDLSLSTGAENPLPGVRFFTNPVTPNLVYLGTAGSGASVTQQMYLDSYGLQTFNFSVDPNQPASNTNQCMWWIDSAHTTLYNIASMGLFGCGGSRSLFYDMHEIGNIAFLLGHADTVQRSGSGFINTVDGGDGLDAMYEFGGGSRYNSFYLELLGWLGPYGSRPILYASHSGVFNITCAADTTPGAKCVKIPRDIVKAYSYVGGLISATNTFYYLEAMSSYQNVGPAVVARLGSPKPYRSTGLTFYTPHSKRILNYGHSGGLITGDSFSDVYTFRTIQQTGPAPSPWTTNELRTPFSAIVVLVTATNATIAVTGL